MSRWKFWSRVRDAPVTKKKVWWKRHSVCPTCGRSDDVDTRQAQLYEFFNTGQKTLEAYK